MSALFLILLVILLVSFLFGILRKESPTKAIEAIFTNTRYSYYDKRGDYNKIIPFIIAQSMYETGGYTSRAFTENNNLFGMKNASIRFQYGIKKESDPYRYYRSYRESSRDMLEWLYTVGFPPDIHTLFDYCVELKNHKYYEDSISNYFGGVNYYYNKIK